MKKTGEIVGLPIISLVDGGEVGVVKSLVLDADKAAIAAVVVDDTKWYRAAKVILFNDILGIGESALTIEQQSSIKETIQVPEVERLLDANVNVLNTKVLSKKGQIQGMIVEIYFDEETGKILECHAKSENGSDFVIKADRVYTFGANITVVADENETIKKPAPTPAPVQQAQPQPPAAAPAPQAQPVAAAPAAPVLQEEAAEDTSDANNAMQKFEERQKKFLLGKKATRKIVTDSGTVIIDQDEEVTEEILQKAKLAGKFVELSMSLQ